MSLQFNCPYCQLLMTADPRSAGGQVQCPACHQLFMIGGMVQAMPVAQARNIPPATPPPLPASAQAPSKPAAPPIQRPGQPRPPSANKPKAKADEGGKGLFFAMIAGVLLLGVGLIYGGIWFIGKMEQNKVSQFELPPEVKARDAARIAQEKKEKEEQDKEEQKYTEESEAYLASNVCDGNTKVAHELMLELHAISTELKAIYADADPDNDPKDLRAFWTKKLGEHTESNNILHHWMGGKPASVLAEALWGRDRSSQRERGRVADFLMGGEYRGTGTGFFIGSEGWLLTNQHVVKDSAEVDIRDADGVIRKAKVIKADADADVALLKVAEPPKNWLHIGTANSPIGADVCTMGFPNADIQGVEPKYTTGTVSSLSGYRDDHDNYQTTVPVQPGNSGGPLVDMKSGDVVGIVASILRHDTGAENVSYAIKVDVVKRIVSSVAEATAVLDKPASSPRGSDGVALASNLRAAIVMVLVK